MASSLIISIKSDLADISRIVKDTTADKEGIVSLAKFLMAGAGGNSNMSVDAQYNASAAPVAASGTVTLANVSADDTVTIGSVTLTAKASPSGENQFSQAGTDTVDGDSLVSKINAHSVLGQIVTASNASGVVTITCLQKGLIGNQVALTSSNGTRLAVSGSGYLAGGTGGACSASVTYSAGL